VCELKWPVGERRDDKAVSAAEKLVHVDGVDVADSNDALVVILAEVEARLLQPLKVLRVLDLHTDLHDSNGPQTTAKRQLEYRPVPVA